jgi:xanthine dehydrogenase molybdopterin-binding subunit B
MNTLNFIAAKLNKMLEIEQFDDEMFGFYIALLKEKYNFEIQLIDFEFYNEERLQQAQTEKKKGLEFRDFEYTANCMELEKICLKCLEYKAEWKIDKSVFLPNPGRNILNSLIPVYFYYCHCGTAKNDGLVKKLIELEVRR